MRTRTVKTALALAFVIVAVPAAAGDGRPWTAAPESARVKTNPFAERADAVRAGSKLFARHCAGCHGEGGRGGSGHAPPLAFAAVAHAPEGQLFWFLTNGRLAAGMPSWSRLPEARRWQIVAFLRTLDPSLARGATNDPPAPRAILGDHSSLRAAGRAPSSLPARAR
jgi:mono/diheme cytochrome c family protein